jgi:hypothetical protein
MLKEMNKQYRGNIRGKHATGGQSMLSGCKLSAHRLVVGVVAPGDSQAVKTCFQTRQYGSVAHTLFAIESKDDKINVHKNG